MTRWQRFNLGVHVLPVVATGLVGVLSIVAQPPSARSQTDFSNTEISNYAKAVLAIEGKRQQVYAAAKKLPEWATVSSRAEAQKINICDLKTEELTSTVQGLCSDFFGYSKSVIESNGFNNNSFNQITRGQGRNTELRSRIQAKMLQLRR